MRYLLMTGLIIGGGAAVVYALRDTPMVRQCARQVRHTATEVGGVVTHAAADIKETATHAAYDQQQPQVA